MRSWRKCGLAALIVVSVAGTSTEQTVASPPAAAPTLSSVSSLQCPSKALCVGIDNAAGNLVTSRAPRSGMSGWPVETIDHDRLLKLLTCASTYWCIAVDEQDRVLFSTDPARGAASWRIASGGAAKVLGNVSALSCPTSRLCVGVAGQYVISSTRPEHGGAAWRQAYVNPGLYPTAIDCPSTVRCVAVSDEGQVLTTEHPTTRVAWTHARLNGRLKGVQAASVSCASATRCVAADGGGNAFGTNNLGANAPQWRQVRLGPSRLGHVPLDLTVSCTTSNLCAAAGNDGTIWASPAPSGLTARHWTRVAVDGPVATITDRLMSIDCVCGQLCVATDADGHALSANAVTQIGAWRRQTIGRPLPAVNSSARSSRS